MFRVLEGKPFIMDRIHKDMFNVFDDLYNLRITRECMNIPPRAGKTTLCKYWLIYCLTKNPRCNFIYTSFSQMLLSDIAREVAQILEHPIYKELYGSGLFGVEEKEENPIDDFWREYLLKETGKAVYASKRIITAKGGQILFASIGSTITGFGCFDYDTEVLTEKGFMKLGYIVENKIDVKVWSYNFDKRQKELQPIYDYVKNENSPYMEIELDNGEKINCTPDHVFYLKNGEERRADFLSVGSEIMSNKFGNRKIVNIVNCNHSAPSYCVTLCRNNNLFVTKSQILVHNCGIRGNTTFSGALVLDDANKPADIQSEVMREKVRKYYDETLLSRLNDSNVPIFNIQQRLHLEDLSGYLLEQYKFDSIVKPLLEPDGTCNIASQYTPERIKEISFNDTMFQAQYQQSPVAEKGNIIQRDWWVMYDADHTAIDGKLIITADTAYKKTKTADYSCFQVWELLRKEMRLRDMIVGKWEFPELLEKAIQIWRKWTDDSLINPAAFMYIEDKASGISLEQTLIQSGINALCWKPKDYDYPEDKVGRTRELSWDVYRGLVKLKNNDKMSQYLVNEAALFAEDMSHAKDDSVDSASMAHSIWRYAGGGQ